MPFVGEIFSQLKAAADTPVLQEIREGQITRVTGGELLELIRKSRTFLAARGLKQGDRCGLQPIRHLRAGECAPSTRRNHDAIQIDRTLQRDPGQLAPIGEAEP